MGGAATSAGPRDVYAAGNTPCIAAHSTVRALSAVYSGNLYQVRRASDKTTKDIGVLAVGGFAGSAAHVGAASDGRNLVVVAPDHASSFDGFRVLLGPVSPVQEETVTNVSRGLSTPSATIINLIIGGMPASLNYRGTDAALANADGETISSALSPVNSERVDLRVYLSAHIESIPPKRHPTRQITNSVLSARGRRSTEKSRDPGAGQGRHWARLETLPSSGMPRPTRERICCVKLRVDQCAPRAKLSIELPAARPRRRRNEASQ